MTRALYEYYHKRPRKLLEKYWEKSSQPVFSVVKVTYVSHVFSALFTNVSKKRFSLGVANGIYTLVRLCESYQYRLCGTNSWDSSIDRSHNFTSPATEVQVPPYWTYYFLDRVVDGLAIHSYSNTEFLVVVNFAKMVCKGIRGKTGEYFTLVCCFGVLPVTRQNAFDQIVCNDTVFQHWWL